MPSRRQFIKLGLISGTVLGTSRVLYGPFVASPIKNPYSYDFIFLKELDLKTLSQFAPVFLKGSLKDSSQVGAALKKVDHAILGLSQSSQDELCQLFDLLNLPIARRLLLGIWRDWEELSERELDTVLHSWRESSLALKRSAYLGLTELFCGSWYADPSTWSELGYEGPPEL